MKLWFGQTVSAFGSIVGGTAFGFAAVLVLGASPVQMGLLTVARQLPSLPVGMCAGVWVDRLRRRPILIGADLGRAVLLASVPAAALWGRLTFSHLAVVAFLVGALDLVFSIAHQAYLPSLVESRQLVEGNSRMAASAAAAEVGGFSLAGLLVQAIGAPLSLAVDAASFVVSAGAITAIREPEDPPVRSPGQAGMWREMVEGAAVVLNSRLLRPLLLSGAFTQLSHGIISSAYMLFVVRTLGFRPAPLGFIFAVGGVTSLLGAVTASRVSDRWGLGPSAVAGAFLSALGALFIGLAPSAGWLGVVCLVANQLVTDPAATVQQVCETSLRQSMAPRAALGRVGSGFQVVGTSTAMLGALVGGALGEGVGLRTAVLVGAGVGFLSAAVLAASPLRRSLDGPEARGEGGGT